MKIKLIQQTKIVVIMNSTFGVEYKLNHSGCLLLCKAALMTKKKRNQTGKDVKNLRLLVIVLFVLIIF
ncbi:MAG: hypothetical protein CMI23_05730 [Opitutae bacterium]|nr:hypothetical protein [Opitutae bacterium]|tara:strand:+ start:744 stop:947 length:204 start_codon:yes stop_codon:yes gene_type:complete